MYTAVNQAFDAVLGRILPEYIKHTSVRIPSRFMHDFDAAIFYGAAQPVILAANVRNHVLS